MEIYKGTATFSGIAIGKILFYHKNEYQIRQYMVSDIKKELNTFNRARVQVGIRLRELYEKNCAGRQTEAEIFQKQAKLLETDSFRRAIESIITSEKVNAAYAVMTNRDELSNTFPESSGTGYMRTDFLYTGNIQPPDRSPWRDFSQDRSGRSAGDPCSGKIFLLQKLWKWIKTRSSAVGYPPGFYRNPTLPFWQSPWRSRLWWESRHRPEWEDAEAIVDGYTGTLYLYPNEEFLKEYENQKTGGH